MKTTSTFIKAIVAAVALASILGSVDTLRAEPHPGGWDSRHHYIRDNYGYWDHDHYHHYILHNGHHGYWDTTGPRIFINVD